MENLTIQRQLRFAPDSVFRALTETPALQKWFGPNSRMNLIMGGALKFSREVNGAVYSAQGKILSFKKNHFIEMTFKWDDPHPANEGKNKKPSVLKFETKEDGLFTQLIVTQSMGENLSSGCEEGWNTVFNGLQGYLESNRVSHNWSYDWSYFSQGVCINSNIEKVFQSFVDVKKITGWFLRECQWISSDSTTKEKCQTGDSFRFIWRCGSDLHGKILSYKENEQLKFKFGIPAPVSDIPVEVDVNFQQLPNGYVYVSLTQSRMPTTERAKVSWHLDCSQGWLHFLQNLKAFVEYGIDLREKDAEELSKDDIIRTSRENIKSYGTIYYVKDVAQSAAFYEKNLGLKVKELTPTWAEIEISAGNSLCLHQTKDGVASTQERGILVLKTRGLKDLKVKTKDLKIGEIQEVHPGGLAIDFRDPDNNHISFYENLSES